MNKDGLNPMWVAALVVMGAIATVFGVQHNAALLTYPLTVILVSIGYPLLAGFFMLKIYWADEEKTEEAQRGERQTAFAISFCMTVLPALAVVRGLIIGSAPLVIFCGILTAEFAGSLYLALRYRNRAR